MKEIQKELEKQEKQESKQQKCLESKRIRIPNPNQLELNSKKKILMEEIITSCGKCGNNQPLLHIPQKVYDILYSEHLTEVHGEKDAVKCKNEYEAQMSLNYRKKCKTKVINGKKKFFCTQCCEVLACFESYAEHMEWHKALKEQNKQFRQRLIINFCIYAYSKNNFSIKDQFQGKYVSLLNVL